MLVTDTGSIPAIHIPVGAKHIPRDIIELACQVQPVIDLISEKGSGEGEITIKVTGGKVRKFLEFAGRWFFKSQNDG